jgi:hypothetical protein
MTYPVKMSVTLRPVDCPEILVGVNGNVTSMRLTETTVLDYDFESIDSCKLTVELINQQSSEAVVVENVSFFDIEDPKFAWSGVYEPVYPEPWATQQQDQGVVLKPQLCPHTYIGWPGKWILTFDVPVFTWIHQVQNLGWIYG